MCGIFYDFHIHSALSPCADDDMTPNNIVNMAVLKGLDVIALTDHNSCGNCRSVMEVGKEKGLLVIPGMELCTSEECHVLCLFSSLDGALEFEKQVKKSITPIKNNPQIYGQQLLMDSMDNVIGVEDSLLLTASGISASYVSKMARDFSGVAIPAHIDRNSYSIISQLGFITEDMDFNTLEISLDCNIDRLIETYEYLKRYQFITDSDAHNLGQISEPVNQLNIKDCDKKNITAKNVINILYY